MKRPRGGTAVLAAVVLCALAATLPSAAAPAAAAKTPAAAAALKISVLSNRADLVSDGDALVQIAVPSGVDPSTVKVDVGGRDVTSAFAVRADGRFLGRVEGLALGPNVADREAAEQARRAAHDHELPEGRPDLLRRADPALALHDRLERPRPGAGRAVQRADDVRVLLHADDRRRLPALRPGEPAGRRRDDDDRPGQHGAVHHPAGDRNAEPRHLPHRGAVRSDQELGAVGRAGRLEPQALLSLRRELRDDPLAVGRAGRAERLRALARLHGRDVVDERARQQLQRRHVGGVGADAEGADRRPLRRDPLHDGERLLRRLDRPAHDEQRLPRARAGHPAELQLRGQHDHGQRGRGLPPPLRLLHADVAAALGRTGAAGCGRGRGDVRALRALGGAVRIRRRSAGRLRPPGRPGLRPRHEPDRLPRRRARLRDLDLRQAPVEHLDRAGEDRRRASPSRRTTTSGSSTGSTRCDPARSRRSSSST